MALLRWFIVHVHPDWCDDPICHVEKLFRNKGVSIQSFITLCEATGYPLMMLEEFNPVVYRVLASQWRRVCGASGLPRKTAEAKAMANRDRLLIGLEGCDCIHVVEAALQGYYIRELYLKDNLHRAL